MPRYLCKVDYTYVFEREIFATDKDEASLKAEQLDYPIDPSIRGNIDVWEVEELPEIAALFTMPEAMKSAPNHVQEAYKVLADYTSDQLQIKTSEESLKERLRKQSDTTKITQDQYDDIIDVYKLYLAGNILGVNSTRKLTDYLNKILGLNKSRSVYSKIWNGGIDRESLSKGE